MIGAKPPSEMAHPCEISRSHETTRIGWDFHAAHLDPTRGGGQAGISRRLTQLGWIRSVAPGGGLIGRAGLWSGRREAER